MKITFSKIFWLIFLIALIALGFWGYKIFKKQNSSNTVVTNEQNKQNQSIQNVENVIQNETPDNSSVSETTETTENIDSNDNSDNSSDPHVNVNDKNPTSGEMLAHITTEHCDTECRAFANNLQFLEYCQQVCGIVPIKTVSDCKDKKDLEKDYCLKDLAINKQDSSICKQIKDVNILQTCQNRIAQDIIENK